MHTKSSTGSNVGPFFLSDMKLLLLVALVGVCWADSLSIKYRDVFKPFSDDLINYINKQSGATWTVCIITPGRRQSKTHFTVDERGLKIARNRVFNCHLSPIGRQMANENSVSNDFSSTFVDSIDVFDCRLSCYNARIIYLKLHFDCVIDCLGSIARWYMWSILIC